MFRARRIPRRMRYRSAGTLSLGMRTLLLAVDPGQLPAGTEARLRAAAPGYDIVIGTDRARIESVLDDIEIAAAWPPRDLVPRMSRLRWWQLWSAGADWLPRNPALVAHPMTVTSAVGIHGVQIGEHVFAMLLALAREIPTAVLAQQQHAWRHDDDVRSKLFELHGRTLVVVGVGAIGGRVAELGNAFGMRVLGVRRHPEKTMPGIERMVGDDELDSVLPEAQVVVSSVPRSPATEGLFDARRIGLLPEGAVFVNVGRGGTVDEAALAAALASGRLRAAALDVTEKEPLPAESPLWDAPNLLITPHVAGLTPRYNERALTLFEDNLSRYLRGAELRNVVDKEAGI